MSRVATFAVENGSRIVIKRIRPFGILVRPWEGYGVLAAAAANSVLSIPLLQHVSVTDAVLIFSHVRPGGFLLVPTVRKCLTVASCRSAGQATVMLLAIALNSRSQRRKFRCRQSLR